MFPQPPNRVHICLARRPARQRRINRSLHHVVALLQTSGASVTMRLLLLLLLHLSRTYYIVSKGFANGTWWIFIDCCIQHPDRREKYKSHCKYHLLAPLAATDSIRSSTSSYSSFCSWNPPHRSRPRCWAGFYSNASNFQSNSLSGITTYIQWAHSQAQLTEAPGWLLGVHLSINKSQDTTKGGGKKW